MEILTKLLSLAVLAALAVTLLFATKAFKNKDNKSDRNAYLRNTVIALVVYTVLNLIRLYVGGQLL